MVANLREDLATIFIKKASKRYRYGQNPTQLYKVVDKSDDAELRSNHSAILVNKQIEALEESFGKLKFIIADGSYSAKNQLDSFENVTKEVKSLLNEDIKATDINILTNRAARAASWVERLQHYTQQLTGFEQILESRSKNKCQLQKWEQQLEDNTAVRTKLSKDAETLGETQKELFQVIQELRGSLGQAEDD
eukprot:GHVT01069016.1.p1 GENE.GHVT01069016.1~~GHVT01069016.1.p1  ORF type:complete len:193 (+),score=20.63 GHVT01069016.1:1293-1871(+)